MGRAPASALRPARPIAARQAVAGPPCPDADDLGLAAARHPSSRRRRFLVGRPPPGRPPPRAGPHQAAGLPDPVRRPVGLCPVLVQPARLDRVAPPSHRARARLRRHGPARRFPGVRLRRAPPGPRPIAPIAASSFVRGPGDGAAVAPGRAIDLHPRRRLPPAGPDPPGGGPRLDRDGRSHRPPVDRAAGCPGRGAPRGLRNRTGTASVRAGSDRRRPRGRLARQADPRRAGGRHRRAATAGQRRGGLRAPTARGHGHDRCRRPIPGRVPDDPRRAAGGAEHHRRRARLRLRRQRAQGVCREPGDHDHARPRAGRRGPAGRRTGPGRRGGRRPDPRPEHPMAPLSSVRHEGKPGPLAGARDDRSRRPVPAAWAGRSRGDHPRGRGPAIRPAGARDRARRRGADRAQDAVAGPRAGDRGPGRPRRRRHADGRRPGPRPGRASKPVFLGRVRPVRRPTTRAARGSPPGRAMPSRSPPIPGRESLISVARTGWIGPRAPCSMPSR